IKKLQENANINTRNQCTSLKNLETQIEQLTKELHSRTTNGAPSLFTGKCKVVNVDHETPHRPISSSNLNNLHEASDFQVAQNEEERTTEVGHADICDPVKKALLKLWLIGCFRDELRIIKNPLSKGFYDFKWVFDLEIDQLADEYELGIGKKDICLIRYGNNVKMSIEIAHISGMTMDLKKRNVMKWE
ncbi:hypothetical protein Tco_1180326, partial [Tanacetum coccineum]